MSETIESIRTREGRTELPDGTILIIEYLGLENDNEAYGDVEEHEAEHAVVALRNGTVVEEASVVPEGNSLGHVRMGSFDPIAAATSKGRAGNGHDRHIVESAGHSFESNGSVAHGMVRKNKEHVRAVASALKRERRLTGKRIQAIMDRVDEGDKMRIRIITPDGKERTVTKHPQEKMLSLSDLPIELPRAA